MTPLDEQRYADLLNADDDPGFVRLVAELDTLGEGSPSQRGELMIRRALAVHALELAQQGRSRSVARILPSSPRLPRRGLSRLSLAFRGRAGEPRPTPVGGVRRRRWTPHLPARLSLAAAASVVALLSVGTYLHGQSPTPVSAQTVLHRTAAASPGPNEATHATYRVSSSDGSTGTADVWIGYDGSGAATQLALNLSMSQSGHAGPRLSASLVAVGPRLVQVYHPGDGPGQVPVPSAPGAQAVAGSRAVVNAPARTMKGIVVGTLLAQKLSNQPGAYQLQQETLDGVPVYALQPSGAGNVTYYFNAQSYVLEGADWAQDGSAWQARLESYSTVPLSAVPAGTFGSGTDAGSPGDKQRIVVSGSASATRQG